MIYGREQFGGFGDAAAVGAAVLPLLPPYGSASFSDRRADYILSKAVAGTNPFFSPLVNQDESYLFDTNPLTSNKWWRASNGNSASGFVAMAGIDGDAQCAAISADIVLLQGAVFPVPKIFISDTPSANGSEVSVKLFNVIETSQGTQQNSNIGTGQSFCKTGATFPQYVGWQDNFLDPPASPSVAVTTFSGLFSTGCPLVPADVVTHQHGTTNLFLWNNGIEQRGFLSVYALELTANLAMQQGVIARVPIPGDVKAARGNGTFSSERNAIAVVGDSVVLDGWRNFYEKTLHLYCSPYTGRGYLHAVWAERVRAGSSKLYSSGITYTFDHSLASRPADVSGVSETCDRYFAGVAVDSPMQLPSGLSAASQGGWTAEEETAYAATGTAPDQYDVIRMAITTCPRVLESTAPPVLPDSSSMVDAEQAMFLDWLGGPSNTLYLDGATQQQPLANQLAEEPFGNQWAANDPGNGNTKRPNYINDYQGVTFLTGQHRHNTLPSSSDWQAVDITVSQPASQFWPVTEVSGVFRGRVSKTALDTDLLDASKIHPDTFAMLQCVKGSYRLTPHRGDGAWIGNNRYTTANTTPGTVLNFDNTDEGYGKTVSGFTVPLSASYQPMPQGSAIYWNGTGGTNYNLVEGYCFNQISNVQTGHEFHVIVGTPPFNVANSALPRLSAGAPANSSYSVQQIITDLYGLGNTKSPLSTGGVVTGEWSDFAYLEQTSFFQTFNHRLFIYFIDANAFPTSPHPYIGQLGAIGSKSTITVTDFCGYLEVLNRDEPDQFTEAIGKPLLTLWLRFGAHAKVESIFAEANIYEMVKSGQTYVPGNVYRTISHTGTTSTTTNFTGFEVFYDLTEAESESFVDGSAVTLHLKQFLQIGYGTASLVQHDPASSSDAYFDMTVTPVPA